MRRALLAVALMSGCRALVVDDKTLVADAGIGGTGGGGGTDASVTDAASDGSDDVSSDGSIEASNDAESDAPSDTYVAPDTWVCPPVTSCAAGTADCNLCATDGCEIDLQNDTNNCGRCGRSCFGRPCQLGMCDPEPLSQASLDIVYHLGIDASHLYFGNFTYIQRIPKAGGPIETLCPAVSDVTGIEARNGYVYFANLWGTVARVPTLGGTMQTLGTLPVYLGHIAVDDDFVFVTNHDPTGFVSQVPIVTGSSKFLTQNEKHSSIAVDDASVYVAADSGLRKMAKDGTNLMTLVPGSGIGDLVVDQTLVYFAHGPTGEIRAIAKSGSPTTVATIVGPGAAKAGVRAGSVRLYFRANDTVQTALKDGSQPVPQTLAIGQSDGQPSAIEIDDAFVYWVGPQYKLFRTPL